jgi:hypothetical protein
VEIQIERKRIRLSILIELLEMIGEGEIEENKE